MQAWHTAPPHLCSPKQMSHLAKTLCGVETFAVRALKVNIAQRPGLTLTGKVLSFPWDVLIAHAVPNKVDCGPGPTLIAAVA